MLFQGPMPGMRPMPGIHPGQAQPGAQEKGRGAIGYLMPVYTVAILILFVYTAMKLVFKRKKSDEDEELEQRRLLRRGRQREGGLLRGHQGEERGQQVRYDEEDYNNLIRQ